MKLSLARLNRLVGSLSHGGRLGRWWVIVPWAVAAFVGVRGAAGQSLLEEPIQGTPAHSKSEHGAKTAQQEAPVTTGTDPNATPAPATPAPTGLEAFSLFAVHPAAPKTWAKHDLVEIIINESSIQKFQQTNDLKKNYANTAELTQFPSLQSLFKDFALKNGIGSTAPAVGVTNDNKYKGDATINRQDQVTAKITAEVIDVKPNGTLVLEAKESIQTDREVSTMVLSGSCRGDDITKSNTVQSSQIAGLNIRIEHEGDVKKTAEKGLIPRIMETIFNF